jgi:lipopolysaccharide export LptBFGC system permease protein LptF
VIFVVVAVRELIVIGAHGLSVFRVLGPVCGGGPTPGLYTCTLLGIN